MAQCLVVAANSTPEILFYFQITGSILKLKCELCWLWLCISCIDISLLQETVHKTKPCLPQNNLFKKLHKYCKEQATTHISVEIFVFFSRVKKNSDSLTSHKCNPHHTSEKIFLHHVMTRCRNSSTWISLIASTGHISLLMDKQGCI